MNSALHSGSGAICRLVRYYAETYHKYDMSSHRHAEAEIMYVAAGGCTVYVGMPEQEKKQRLREKSYIYLPENTPHRLFVTPGKKCRILNLEFSLPDDMQSSLLESQGNYRLLAQNAAYGAVCADIAGEMLHAIMALQRFVLESRASGSQPPETPVFLSNILLLAGNHYIRQLAPQTGISRHVRKALQYIAANFDEVGLCTAGIAADCGISSAYLQRSVKLETGQCLSAHILNLRMGKAQRLLLGSRLNIDDIAAECGYNSRQSFTLNFTRFWGESPGQYRQNNPL